MLYGRTDPDMQERRRARRSIILLRSLAVALLLFAASLALGTLLERPGVERPGVAAADGIAAGDPAAAATTHRILLLKGPIHSDIALPADPQTRQSFAFLADAGLPASRPDVEWIIVGWGGRSFYTETPTWADLKPMPLLKTITGDASAMHVALAGPIDADHPDVRAFELTGTAYQRMVTAMLAGFTPGPDAGTVEIAGKNYGPYDRFFEAEGTFHLLANCNAWTAAMLREAGIATGLWTPLPGLLFLSLDLHGGN